MKNIVNELRSTCCNMCVSMKYPWHVPIAALCSQLEAEAPLKALTIGCSVRLHLHLREQQPTSLVLACTYISSMVDGVKGSLGS